MSKLKAFLIPSIITVVVGFVTFYLFLPAVHVQSGGFWVFIGFLGALWSASVAVCYEIGTFDTKRFSKIIGSVFLLYLAILIVGGLSGAKLFRAKAYSRLIASKISDHDFSDYTPSLDNVPLLDKDSAMNLANRKMGGLQDVISQFEIDDTEQVTVRGLPVRIACLNHAGFFKWLNNKEKGTPGFIKVDMNTQEADLVRVPGGIRYTKSDYFSRDLHRYVRFKYPTKIFAEPTFELDEQEHPYWIVATLSKKIGMFGGTDVSGLVLLDAVTGEHTYYEVGNIPEWIDNVYDSKLLLNQYDNYGVYHSGFLNSIIGQKGVRKSTEGYNYIPQGNDNWIYTGVTSVGRDESNIGFVLINKRTKETHYYAISGAEEFSAMDSAQGAVQHLGYSSTFPLLLKIEDEPTYLVSLKDRGGLIKMYGMVNVQKYQIVATGTSIQNTLSEYKQLLREHGIGGAATGSFESQNVSGIIHGITSATFEGSSLYFVSLKDDARVYVFDIRDSLHAALMHAGDTISFNVKDAIYDTATTEEKIIIPAQLD